MSTVHMPVMLREVLDGLQLRPGQTIVDGTAGGGGHSAEILKQIGETGRLIAVDRDATMLARAAEKLNDPRAILKRGSYITLRDILNELSIDRVDAILVDLGYSSDQIADVERGFSFSSSGPLDMRFHVEEGEPVWQILKTIDQAGLEQILTEYGEERFARQISAAIIAVRKHPEPMTAVELTSLIEQVYKQAGVHSSGSNIATQTFQALRIYANAELKHVEQLLTSTAPDCLKVGGRMVVITFHSLEDRLVKQCFKKKQLWQEATKKPIEPRPTEVRFNPRSRSAKIRIATYQPSSS